MFRPAHYPMLIALFLMLFTGGCRTVNLDATGQNQAAFNYGKFEMVMHRTTKPLADSAEKAFKDLDLFMVSKDVQDYSAELKARTRQDKMVHVEIKEINSRETMLSIKVGMRGDLKLSRALYDRIEKGSGNANGSAYDSGAGVPLWDQSIPAQ